jgi:glycerol-3-phosphate cytidylyltransferase-like family protein
MTGLIEVSIGSPVMGHIALLKPAGATGNELSLVQATNDSNIQTKTLILILSTPY